MSPTEPRIVRSRRCISVKSTTVAAAAYPIGWVAEAIDATPFSNHLPGCYA
jgi:hypothetical protein